MHTQKPTTVLLVDDHPLMRKGLSNLLQGETDIVVVAEASNGKQAIKKASELSPDVVVMDISMPDINGIDATRSIIAHAPQTRVVALSIHSESRFVDDMLEAGAVGYVLKDSAPEELVEAIHTVIQGKSFLSAPILSSVISRYRQPPAETRAEAKEDSIDRHILQTKLHAPKLPVDYVNREKLLERLKAGRYRPLTLVSAPAGYGKSVLIASWIKSNDWPAAWLSLDSSDSNLRSFLTYFISSVRQLFPAVCEKLLQLMDATDLPKISTLIAMLSNELDLIDQPFVIVLDDYHVIKSSSVVNEFIDGILTHPPIPLHLIITTRFDPPLSISKLRGIDQVSEIRMLDLKFDTSETRSLLEKNLHLEVNNTTLANLAEELEGWAVGLRLVILLTKDSSGLDKLSSGLHGGLQQTQQYLVREVVAGLPENLRNWLTTTALLDRFCAPLCNAIYSEAGEKADVRHDSNSYLTAAVKANLFLIPLDNGGEWYRFHHLLQQLLQHELQNRLSMDDIAELHLRASAWFEQHNLVDEAIKHALAAGNIEQVAQVVDHHANLALKSAKFSIVEKWLSLIPEVVINKWPGLLWAKLWVLYRQMDIAATLAVISRIDELNQKATSVNRYSADVMVFRAFFELLNNNGPLALEYIEQAIKLEQSCLTDQGRALADLMYGLINQTVGQQGKAIDTLSSWLHSIPMNQPTREINLAQTLVIIRYISANPVGTEELLQRATEVSRLSVRPGLKPWTSYLYGFIQLQKGNLDGAVRDLEETRSQRYSHHIRGAIDAMCALTLVYQVQGMSESANSILESLREFITDRKSFLSPLVDACEARLALMQGRLKDAVSWQKRTAVPQSEMMFFWFEIPCLTYCRVLIEEGSITGVQQALELLHEYEEMNVGHHNTLQLINILALQALAYVKQNKVEKGAEVLKRALALAQPGGFIFPFFESGKSMVDLLTLISTDDSSASTVLERISSILAMHEEREQAVTVNPVNQRLWTSLTSRERDILKLLAERLQNKEIAARLFVSPETIKSYLKHIYHKLDVHNRRDASLVAKELLKTTNE